MSDDPYVYPGTQVLRNKLDIRDADTLDAAERRLVAQRAAEGIPTGDFDLSHLRSIHRHLFQDIYDWAGELRTVEISKGGDQFMFRQYIETGMADVHRRIVAADYFRGSNAEGFATAAGKIIGDVNFVHPFREGNGRTQLLYLAQLAQGAGHHLALRQIDAAAWLDGSRRAHETDYAGFRAVIRVALNPRDTSPSADVSAYLREQLEEAAKLSKEPDQGQQPMTETGRGRPSGRDRE